MQLLATSEQSGPVEDYLHGCLTKMLEMTLEEAVSTMLIAMNHILEVKIREPEAGNNLTNSNVLCKEQ